MTAALELRSERVHGPTRRVLLRELRAFNAAKAGKDNFKPLTITVRDKGRVVGGVSAETWFGWMFVNLLWLDEKHRRGGTGRALMAKVEAEARARGVTNVYLDTFSFQAPGFYKKLGYREFGRLDEYPAGHSRHWLTKAL
jgi:GNAT superfamily N-acetyltransferase